VRCAWRTEREREGVIEGDVGDEGDERREQLRDEPGTDGNRDGQPRDDGGAAVHRAHLAWRLERGEERLLLRQTGRDGQRALPA
jgi:hypothetical protein